MYFTRTRSRGEMGVIWRSEVGSVNRGKKKKKKKASEHAQHAHIQITLRMRKVSSGPLLSIRILHGIQ